MKRRDLSNLGSLWAYLANHSPATKADLAVFQKRLDCEGIDFLTKELPRLGKDLDRALIVGSPFELTARFGKHPGSELPEFLYSIFNQILWDDGTLKQHASPHHIKWGRQLTLMFFKLEVQHDEDSLEAAFASFRDCDISLDTPLIDEEFSSALLARASGLLSKVLHIKPCSSRQLVFRHGPGATACRSGSAQKYHLAPRFIRKLHNVFDYSETFFVNATHLCDQLKKLTHGPELDQPVSRISAVPKDSRGPRLICMEPREVMYVQQGLMRVLVHLIERHPLTRGFVNFASQSVNKDLAREASIHQGYATLDLKDASDRVRWDLVAFLLPFDWVVALHACRTEYVEFPNGYTFGPLEKFAPMGSAVCFPIESLIFWALLKAGLRTDVYVYGDDIILPTPRVDEAIAILERFSLKVNVEKSCYRTPFRESCGGDYFDGHDVGYVKCRKLVEKTVSSHQSFVGLCNEVINCFGIGAARELMSFGDRFYYPHVRTLSDLPLSYRCPASASNAVFFKRRWHPSWQKYQYLIPTIKNRIQKLRTHPKFHWCELLRKLSTEDSEFKIGEYADGTCIVKEAWRGDI